MQKIAVLRPRDCNRVLRFDESPRLAADYRRPPPLFPCLQHMRLGLSIFAKGVRMHPLNRAATPRPFCCAPCSLSDRFCPKSRLAHSVPKCGRRYGRGQDRVVLQFRQGGVCSNDFVGYLFANVGGGGYDGGIGRVTTRAGGSAERSELGNGGSIRSVVAIKTVAMLLCYCLIIRKAIDGNGFFVAVDGIGILDLCG